MSSISLLQDIISKGIQITDEDEYLKVYCAKDPDTKFKKSIRGTIFSKKDDSLVYIGFPYTEEVHVDDVERIESLCLETMHCCWSHEGTILKLFYYEPKGWYMSTHRKLDAFKSRWVSIKSFGDLFVDSLSNYNLKYDEFFESLDKNKRYHFIIISNEETRIVIKPELQKESLYVVLITDSHDKPIWPLESVCGIPPSEEIKVENAEQIIGLVNNVNPFEKQGLIFFNDDFTKHFRILNSVYRDYSNIRNNIANKLFCYIEARRNEDTKQKFLTLYPEMTQSVEWCEKRLKEIATQLFEIYNLRYKRKDFIKTSHERHDILKLIHCTYLENRIPIQLREVERILNLYTKTNRLYKIVMNRDCL
jgi:hypothetical protein